MTTRTRPVEPETTEYPGYVKAVRRGAALLDEKVSGWAERVKPATLRMEDADFCVLGQVFVGSVSPRDVFDCGYSRGCQALFGDSDGWSVRVHYGFTGGFTPLAVGPLGVGDWDDLARAWREEIALRRAVR